MDTPGLDVESVTGMVGGGAQVVVFTTGLGTPTGNPIAPVIKITGNARTARQMADNIDLDVSGIMDDTETLDVGGRSAVRRSPGGRLRPSDRRRDARPPRVRDSSAQSRPSDGRICRPECRPLRSRLPNAGRRRPLRPSASASAAAAGIICGLLFFADDHQLHRSAGDRHPQADAAERVRLVRDRLRRHRLRLPARLCDRPADRRPLDGSVRHAARFRRS